MGSDFQGKTALVTGVGRPGQIGHAVARALGDAGARLVIAARDAAQLAERAKEYRAARIETEIAAGDLAEPAGARAAVAVATRAFGGLDVVVNVAGGFVSYGPAAEVAIDAYELEMRINARTTFCVCQAAIPALAARGGGAIVNFSSIAVHTPLDKMAAYTAAKGAVAGLTHALSRELRDRRIRVNAVAPATVRTAANVADMGPDARYVDVEDLVATVLYLASPSAQGITGQIVAVTPRGGQ